MARNLSRACWVLLAICSFFVGADAEGGAIRKRVAVGKTEFPSDAASNEHAPGDGTNVPVPLAVSDLMDDADAGDLSGWREDFHYGSLALADSGGDDRLLQRYEFGVGNDPWADDEVFAILQAEATNECKTEWNGASGKTYAVQSEPLPNGSFAPVESGLPTPTLPDDWTNDFDCWAHSFFGAVAEP